MFIMHLQLLRYELVLFTNYTQIMHNNNNNNNNNNKNNKIYLNSEHSRKLKAYQGQPRAKHMHASIAAHLTITTKATAKLKI